MEEKEDRKHENRTLQRETSFLNKIMITKTRFLQL